MLAGRGAWLALAARNIEKLEAVAKECRQRGGRALVIPTDVYNQAQCKALIERTVEEYERIDTLINNAGFGMWSLLEDLHSLDLLERLVRVNYLGSVYPTYYALPYLKTSKGRIAAFSSVAGKTGVPTRSGYSASKHALVGFFESLRIELLDSDVSVTLLFPDFVATGTHERNVGPDGEVLGTAHQVDYSNVMTTEECVEISLRAIEKRKRQAIMSTRGKFGQWLKLIAPGVIDRIAQKAIQTGR